jgi:spore germination protein KC
MRVVKKVILTIIFLFTIIGLLGCWNYRELESISIVTGIAIDKSADNKYLITVELVELKGGMEAKTVAKTVTMTGETIFDTVRNTISLSAKRLYWSHTKVLILSKDIAKEDIVKILDWFNRDAETREDISVLVSKGTTAKEILENGAITNEVVAFQLDDMLRNENSISKAPIINIADFIIDLAGKGISPIAPAIGLVKTDNEITPQIMGTALFAKDKLINFLNGDESKELLFIRNLIRGGLIVQNESSKEGITKITLEIFENKTNIKPILKKDIVEMQVNIKTTVIINEIQGIENYIDEEKSRKLEKDTEQNMDKQIENLINKVKSEYGSDIFGFGAKIKENNPNMWRKLEPYWKEKFKNLKVTVNSKVHIKNSSALYKTLPVGD